MNGAMLPFLKALKAIAPETPKHFFNLAALQMRRHLIDLSRRFFGQYGLGSKHDTWGAPADDPGGPLDRPDGRGTGSMSLEKWTELHEAVEALPAEQREVVDLLYYQGLTQGEAARILEVDVRTVRRRWALARETLGQLLDDELAGGGK